MYRRPATLLKKRLWHKCFPVNFAKFLRTTFFYRRPLVATSGCSVNLDFSSKQNVTVKEIMSNFLSKKHYQQCFFFEKYLDFDLLPTLIHKILSSIKKSWVKKNFRLFTYLTPIFPSPVYWKLFVYFNQFETIVSFCKFTITFVH